MTSSIRSAELLREFLGQMNSDADPGAQGRKLMEYKLRAYLARQAMKKAMQKKTAGQTATGRSTPSADGGDGEVSEALKRKDREREAKAASRRRVRGGAPPVVSSRDVGPAETMLAAINQQEDVIMA
jgi:DNA excision repair protein ERCC-4